MNTRIGSPIKQIAKVLVILCAMEMVLPGGTLFMLGDLLTGQRQG